MRKYLFILFFIATMPLFTSAEIKVGNDWKLTGEMGDVRVFEKNQMTLSLLEGMTLEQRNINSANYKSEIAKSLNNRKSTMEFFGAELWAPTNIQYREVDQRKIIMVSGHYRKGGMNYEFVEWQVYSDKQYKNIQVEFVAGDQNARKEVAYFAKYIEEGK